MLVLTRHRNQSIMIGREVEMTVLDVRGDKIRVGFKAPDTIEIHRKEVFDEIMRENVEAAQMRPADLDAFLPKRNGRAQPSADGNGSKGSYHMDPFLRAAIDEARRGLSEGGLPIGSVLVRDGQIIGRGHNRRVQNGNPMAHAEIDCLSNAGRQKTYRDTILYSTLMPCYLCTGAVAQFGIPKVVVGESQTFPGGECACAHGGNAGPKSPDFLRSCGVELIDLHDQECIDMMSAFIREHPALWNEDIGVEPSLR